MTKETIISMSGGFLERVVMVMSPAVIPFTSSWIIPSRRQKLSLCGSRRKRVCEDRYLREPLTRPGSASSGGSLKANPSRALVFEEFVLLSVRLRSFPRVKPLQGYMRQTAPAEPVLPLLHILRCHSKLGCFVA